jgi:hypothetical protein
MWMANGFGVFVRSLSVSGRILADPADAGHLTGRCERPCDQPGSLQRPDPTEESGLGSP